MIRVGILGSGFISDSYAEALLDVRGAELVANYSRDAARAEILRRALGARGHSVHRHRGALRQ